MDEIVFRGYQPGDEHQILDLFNREYHRKVDSSQWLWIYTQNPLRRNDLVLAFCGPSLVGELGAVPLTLRHKDRLIGATRLQNLIVDPAYRSRGIYRESVMRLTRQLEQQGVDFVIGFPNDNSFPAFIKHLDYRHLGEMPLHRLTLDVRPAEPGPAYEHRARPDAVFDEADSVFVESHLSGFEIVNHRRLEYLNWRYHPNTGKEYRTLRCYEGDRQVGLAVFKVFPPDGSIDLVEFLLPPDPGAVLGALAAIRDTCGRSGPTVFNTWSMDHYPWHSALLAAGFRDTGQTTHVIYRRLSARCPDRCGDLRAYYLSLGDSDVY
jgi:hypothetical protein